MSERGPQFTSWARRSFCAAFGVSVSLSSGYHPQSNGQSERTLKNVLRPTIQPPRGYFSLGLNMRTTLGSRLPLICLLSWRLWAINLLSLISRRTKWPFHYCGRACVAAGVCEGRSAPPWHAHPCSHCGRQNATEFQLCQTAQIRRFGCPPMISLSRPSQRSWRLRLWGPSK